MPLRTFRGGFHFEEEEAGKVLGNEPGRAESGRRTL